MKLREIGMVYASEAARTYAADAFHNLSLAHCPGTKGHEGTASGMISATYCDACLEHALAQAWLAGGKTKPRE